MTTPLPLRIADELERTHPHEAAATLRAQHKLIGELVACLTAAVNEAVATAESGDCGFYDPEQIDWMPAARAVLLKAKEQS